MKKLIDTFQKAMPMNPIETSKMTIALDITAIANGINNELEDFKTVMTDEISTSSIDIIFNYKDGGAFKEDGGILTYSLYTLTLTLKFKDMYNDLTKLNDLENLLKKIQTYVVTSDVVVKKLSAVYGVTPGKPVIDLDDE